ncbi:UDP-N-acetylglucosamine 2-epimerase [Pseudoalteromonas xiamenensis]|uniref:UDP-N-acetylglucosamine 2-epimerase n=1 Tax=Pseudoalteromonas xiamenensis TaxID=882626 RepID=UPI0027E5603D|nr:UDP-N-acetylglucosamine 2-epimerase [Pseudoalteromonas xiamenensis]WMN59379.1 UDP-N-acetylglucosamine 2-epimerase [Pseudoalteromonas xiamenensis]
MTVQVDSRPKIMLVTTSRAEFGLFYWLIKALQDSTLFNFQLIVTGNHLSVEQGYTLKEIEQEGIKITEIVEIMFSGVSDTAKTKSSAHGMLSFADVFSRHRPDLLIIMGDRYELLGIASAAALMSVPIAHFSGGEITQGVIDDVIRHTITKLSHFHFVSNKKHAQRVRQLGEAPDRIFNVGEPGLEHLKKTPMMNISELSQSIGFELSESFALFTFHPVVQELGLTPEMQLSRILDVLETESKLQYLITFPNFDIGGEVLLEQLKAFEERNRDRVKLVSSLGFRRYLSALHLCKLVIGNSSSGLVEAPCFGKVTLNIGSRQSGRLKGRNVIDCGFDPREIRIKLKLAMNDDYQEIAKTAENPYGDGNTVSKVVNVLRNTKFPIEGIKRFHDLEDKDE